MNWNPTRSIVALLALLWGVFLLQPVQIRAADTNQPPPLSQYGIDTWSGSDGLPQIRIRAIVQTRDGYLWLGTANGLVRFDGVNFTTFGIDTSSLKDNEIGSLVQDDEGALWIGTYGGGLTRFKDGQFTTFTTADGLPDNSSSGRWTKTRRETSGSPRLAASPAFPKAASPRSRPGMD